MTCNEEDVGGWARIATDYLRIECRGNELQGCVKSDNKIDRRYIMITFDTYITHNSTVSEFTENLLLTAVHESR